MLSQIERSTVIRLVNIPIYSVS